METVLKKPYEISIWEDRQYYVYTLDNDRGVGRTVPDGWTVVNDFLKEEKIAIVGGDKLDSPIRVFNPKLTEKVNGEHILTFQLSAKYIEDGEPVWNPFYSLLCNEQKIKLNYDGKWFEFSIKKIEETSENQIYNYTCAEVVTETLGRTGYDVELSEDYENNMGSVTYLAEKAVAGSEWQVASTEGTPQIAGGTISSDVIKQYANEALFVYTANASLPCTVLEDYTRVNPNGSTQSWTKGSTYYVPANSPIYIFYSDLLNETPQKQFFWVSSSDNVGGYITDEDGNIVNSPQYVSTGDALANVTLNNVTVSTQYRGDKLIDKQITKYIPQIDQYCKVYTKDNTDYYCLETTEYTSSTNIQELLTNNVDFTSARGWSSPNGLRFSTDEEGVLNIQSKQNTECYNSGPYDNRSAFKNGISPGDTFYIDITYGSNQSGSYYRFQEVYLHLEGVNFNSDIQFTQGAIDLTTGKQTYSLTIGNNFTPLSYNDLLGLTNFYIKFKRTANTSSNNIKIVNISMYRHMTDGAGRLVKPSPYFDGGTTLYTEIIKPTYHFFNENSLQNATSLEDIKFVETQYYQISDYIPKMSNNFEKIRSLEVRQSNRFNIIQKLCETFECWVKFVTNYDSNGRVIYGYHMSDDTKVVKGKRYYTFDDESSTAYGVDYRYDLVTNPTGNPHTNEYYEKVYDKFIQFKEYISKDNYAGFRRGINLKSVSRRVLSDNITTKLIVEQNNNEMAEPLGSCDIQTSKLNTYGETALYNFDYYINQRILEKEDIYRDLYGNSASSGLKFLTQMSKLNNDNQGYINELAEVQNTLTRAQAQLQVSKATVTEAAGQEADNKQYLADAGYTAAGIVNTILTNPQNYPDVIVEYARKANEARLRKEQYTPLNTQNQAAVNGYTAKVEELKEDLAEIREEKNALLREFNSKYSRYIREGSWIDEDYFDADLYYLDGLGVLFNSAFPKVEYTINVIDISQLEEYQNYNFSVGDKSYVEDVEFFGYEEDKITPYKQEVIVDQVVWSLDDPSQNTISVKNFKDEFDSLFQRVTAATQSLQYSEGGYARAAMAVRPEGILDSALMKKTLGENTAVITNLKDQTVTWDNTGITITSPYEAEKIVRLVNGGIVLTEDGGKSWTTGITAGGINASTITTGVLDADLIRVYNGSNPSFVWDGNGLNAYEANSSGFSNQSYVRFNHDGLIGKYGNNTIFELNWEGLTLNSIRGNGYLHLQASNSTGTTKQKVIWAGTGSTDKFIVYSDGSIKATDGEFTGTIQANDLKLPNGSGGYVSIVENNKIKNNYLDLGNIVIDGTDSSITIYNKKSGTGRKALIVLNDRGIIFNNNSLPQQSDNPINREVETTSYIPSYITSTKITSTTIESPTIRGGTFYATGGTGDYYAQMTGSGFSVYRSANNTVCASLSSQGSRGSIASPYGLFINAGTGELYLQAGNGLILDGGMYGTEEPVQGVGAEGRIYFQIMES